MKYRGIEGKKEFNANEQKFIDYCIGVRYKIRVCKQYQSKTVFTIDIGNDILESYEIPNLGDYIFNSVQFQKSMDLSKEIVKLRKEAFEQAFEKLLQTK